MFLAFIHASKLFRAHFALLFVFSGTRPLANSGRSSSLVNVKRLDAVWMLEVGLVEWFAVVEMGGTAGRGKLRNSHILRQYGSEQAFSY